LSYSNFFFFKREKYFINSKCIIKYYFSIKASTAYSGGLMDVDKELFLWSVIAGRKEFSLLFWSRGKNKICK
jgi:hypothetical protein